MIFGVVIGPGLAPFFWNGLPGIPQRRLRLSLILISRIFLREGFRLSSTDYRPVFRYYPSRKWMDLGRMRLSFFTTSLVRPFSFSDNVARDCIFFQDLPEALSFVVPFFGLARVMIR
jgi:hypothetical protein